MNTPNPTPPDLLAASEDFLTQWEGTTSVEIAALRAAVAKARGVAA